MNNKYFRVIFSKVLNCLVVVSELAKSEGKDNKKCGAFLLPFSQFLGKLKPIAFRFFCALGFVTFTTHALAETLIIQADKAAPKNQQPIILHTANGLPQVNIQTPNAQGLSHNKYTKFDVDTKGAILNNSASNVKTQQAGWIQANPYLAKGEAKVILNEVNSHDPSVLKGYVEVAGKKADVIIANPSGLHCDGCGIINAHRATFTTGQAQINNGHLEGFVVEKGRVTVSGKGLDNSKVDYTEILAREVQANAGIWSKKDLKVATGKNHIKRTSAEENLQILHTQEENSAENAPHFAIDVGELGGMYAGKIHLIGTENGVGVRNAGHIGASADSLVIDSRGRIVNTGTLSANNKLDLTTAKNIENRAKVESRQGSIKFNSAENIQQHGIVVALKGNIQMRGENIHQQGKTLAKENIDLHATELNNHDGIILAEGATLNLQVGKLSNKQGAIVAHNLNVKVQNNADNTDGTIQGKESLNLSAQVLNNQNGLIQSANLINLTAKTLVSEGNIKTAGDLNISLQDSFTLNKAFSVGNHLNFSTKGDFANNSALQVKGNVNISANQITNNRDAEISANHTALNAETLINRGLIDGYKTHVYGKNVTNIGTGRIYGDYLVFNSEYLNNLNENKSSATIGARERLDFAVDKIGNHKGSSIISLGNIYFGGKLDDNQQAIGQGSLVENHNALIEAMGDISLNVKKVENLHNLLEVEMRETSKTPVFEYGFANEPTRYAKEGITKVKRGDSGGGLNKKVRNLYALRLPNGRESESWREYNYTRTINETMVIPAEYSEAQILSGGNIHFFSTDVKNYDSKILAHGEISLNNGGNIDNHATEGTVITTEKGRMSYFYNGRACAKKVFGKCIDHYRTTQSYSLPYVNRTETSKNLGLWDYGSLQSSNLTLSTEISSQNVAENVNLASTPREAHLPTSSLYTINPESPNGYFVETDPKFTQHRQWLSSDYMFNQLRHEHNNVHKRLGDGYYEQRLINEQINQLTGRRFLTGYNNELEQYKALMNEGVKYAKQFDLKLGIALTKEQMSELTTDMVWFVNKVFTLPNGQKVTALVPQVYLVPRHSDITAQGALISANTIIGTLDNVQNSGIIAGRKLTQINAEQINNQGVILGDTVDLSAKQHLINLGGKIEAVDKLSLSAGKNLEIASTLRETKTSTDFARRVVDKMSQLKVSGEKGKLSLQADGDLTVKGALIKSQGNIEAIAKNIESATLAVYNKEHYNADADNYYRLNQKTEVGSQFTAKNAVVLLAEQDIHLRQAELSSKQADVTLQSSTGNIDIVAGKTEEQVANSIKSSTKGLFSSSTELTRHQHHYTETVGSNIDGESVKVLAEQGKVQVSGSTIVGEQDVAMVAKNGIDIVAETNLSKEQDEHYSRKSGLLGSGGGIGFTIGQKKERTEQEQQTESVAHSQVGSLKGNVTLLTEGDY
ncbi:filamentous hemagglutinin N-terminal domain-containing protein, partial [Haemophilus haemoglobinophilus]|nr:filamentous hemagglutinin N-terminal domain-containing protein [Canicola haemoglobinophilus]